MINPQQKIYKSQKSSNFNMLPGDLKGSPDESFYSDTLVFIDANFLSKLSNYFGKVKKILTKLH